MPRLSRMEPGQSSGRLTRRNLLRLGYVARVALVSIILIATLSVWEAVDPRTTFYAVNMFIGALAFSGASAVWTEVLGREPGRNFLVGHVAFDTLLVAGVVHIAESGTANFAWLYILVITEGALLLPLSGGILIAILASMLYFAEIVWGQGQTSQIAVAFQMGLFVSVALASGFVGDRLRGAGAALGQVQSELRRLRLDTGDILATMSSGVLTLGEDGRLAYMNPAAEALLGLDARQWDGAVILDRLGEIAPALALSLQRTLEERRPVRRGRAEAEFNGRHLVFGVSTFLREEPDQAPTITAVFQDITDLERVDQLNRRAERLESVATFSAAMAHEIRNPLTSILSAVELFASPGLDEEDRTKLTRMVMRESERLTRLLSEFLDYARVRVELAEDVDLTALVEECAGLARRHPTAEASRVRIRVRLPSHEVLVPADADLIHRAVFNLLLNAVQFSPEGAHVEIGLDDLRDDHRTPAVDLPRPVRIRVRDHGPGIPSGDRDRVFDPFFTTRRGGSGLGLAVVDRTAEAHGGLVFVDCPKDGGTEFALYLPGVRAASPRDGGPPSAGPSPGPGVLGPDVGRETA